MTPATAGRTAAKSTTRARIHGPTPALQRTDGHGGVAARDLPHLGKMDEVLADLLLGELSGRLVVMLGQHAHGANVDILRGGGQTVQLQVLDESLT